MWIFNYGGDFITVVNPVSYNKNKNKNYVH